MNPALVQKNCNRYDSIDGMRLIMALMVAVLHVGLPLGFGNKYLADIARNAVPFFYMCSGFFIYNSNYDIAKKKIRKSIGKTTHFLFVTTIVYLVLEYLLWQDSTEIIHKICDIVSINTIFFNSTPFMPVGWYLMALIYTLLIVRILLSFYPKPNLLWYVIIIMCLLYTLVTGVYQKILFENSHFSLMYNCCWLSALPWVLIGMCISHMSNTVNKVIKNKYLIIAVIIGVLLCLFEHFIIKKYWGMVVGTLYLGTILSAIALFVYLVENQLSLKKIAPLGRVYSSNIYFYHVACNYALCALCGVKFNFPMGGLITLPFDYTILINCFSTSLLAAIIPLFINKTKRIWN